MPSELERWVQATMRAPRIAATNANALLQSLLEGLFPTGSGFGFGAFGLEPFGGGGGLLVDATTIRANGNTQMMWDAAPGAGGVWDDYCWDTPPAALTVGGFVWDRAGAVGQWDGGAVWQ